MTLTEMKSRPITPIEAPPGIKPWPTISGSRGSGVAKGVYTDIVTIITPDTSIPGNRVDITVRIKNLYSSTIGIMAGGALEYGVIPWPSINFPDPIANVGPGQTRDFNGYFYMPDIDVTIHAYSYYYTPEGWYFDDEATKKVRVGGWELLDTRYAGISVVVPGWQLLDTDWISISATIPGWQLLDSRTVPIGLFIPPSIWEILDGRNVAVKLSPPPALWELIDESSLTVELAPPTVGWGLLDTEMVSVVAGPPAEYWEVVYEAFYPYAYIYDGDVQTSTFDCKLPPEQLIPVGWYAEPLAQAVESEVRKRGGKVIALRVQADTRPTLWTDYKIQLVAILPEQTAAAVAIPIWAAILIAAVAIAALVAVITWSIVTIKELWNHQPISEEVKLTWSRETLMSAVQDFEEYLERPITPIEDLEQMSDQELRDYCNQLAEAVSPPAGNLWALAVAAGVVVAGAGIALAARKEKPAETRR